MKLLHTAVMNALTTALQVKDSALAMVKRYPTKAEFDLLFKGENGEEIEGHFEADRDTLNDLARQMRHNRHSSKPEVVKVSPSSLELHEIAHDPMKLGISHSVIDEHVPVSIEVMCTGFRNAKGTHEMQIRVSDLPGLYRAYFDLSAI